MVSIGLIVVMATNLFQDDKLAYVYDTALSSARAKASTIDSQLNSFIQSLKALTANYDPNIKKLSNNGQSFFRNEGDLKAFLDFDWNGEAFVENYRLLKNLEISSEEQASLEMYMQEAWHSGFTIAPSQEHPLHLYLIAKSQRESMTGVTLLLVETTNFFSLFDNSAVEKSYLFHSMRGIVAGNEPPQGLDTYLDAEVFSKNYNEGTKESHFGKRDFLTSYSKVGKANLYIVSLIDKRQALSAVHVLMRRSLVFTSIILCVLVIIGVFASSSLTRAIRGLADATSKVMDGDFTVRVEEKSGDEIGVLAKSFNRMTEEVSRLLQKTAENARMEAELQTAQTVQDTLFPQSDAQIGPISIFGKSVPASECGGDWWYYSQVGDKVYIWIADATGHGVPAALLTSAARAVASVIEGIPGVTPGRALEIMNKAIYSTSKGKMMMTFFIASIDLKNRTLTYANASHDPPFYLSHEISEAPKRRDYVPLMDVNNARLGENPNSTYDIHEMPFHEGDKIILYTDGVFDVKSPEGETWGERRFLKSMSGIKTHKVNEVVESVFSEIVDFRKDTPLDDDVTLVLVEYEQKAQAA